MNELNELQHRLTKPVDTKPYWALLVEGRPFGNHRHYDIEVAKAEAKRLMLKEGRKVTVYQAVAVIGLPPDIQPYSYDLRGPHNVEYYND